MNVVLKVFVLLEYFNKHEYNAIKLVIVLYLQRKCFLPATDRYTNLSPPLNSSPATEKDINLQNDVISTQKQSSCKTKMQPFAKKSQNLMLISSAAGMT